MGAGGADFRGRAEASLRQLIEGAGVVVLVSRSTDLTRSVRNRAVWLEKGQVRADGTGSGIVEQYLAAMEQITHRADPRARSMRLSAGRREISGRQG